MSSDDLNPDEAPGSASNDTQPRARWQIVPTTLLAVLGGSSIAIGLRVLTITVRFLLIRDAKWRFMVVVCAVWLGIGLSWMMAARFIWKQCYRKGVIAALIGVIIRIMLFSIS